MEGGSLVSIGQVGGRNLSMLRTSCNRRRPSCRPWASSTYGSWRLASSWVGLLKLNNLGDGKLIGRRAAHLGEPLPPLMGGPYLNRRQMAHGAVGIDPNRDPLRVAAFAEGQILREVGRPEVGSIELRKDRPPNEHP